MNKSLVKYSIGFSLAVLLLFSSCGTKNAIIKISTNHGDIKVKLYNETPAHRDTFLALVKKGYYDNLLFHRVIEDFVVQGGDPTSKTAKPESELGSGGRDFQMDREIDTTLIHKRGALAFANIIEDDSTTQTEGGQFYIVQGKSIKSSELSALEKKYGTKYTSEQKEEYKENGGLPHLDRRNTVFGEVVKGMDVIDKIAKLSKNGERPQDDVRFTITILKELKND